MVGLLPLIACEILEEDVIEKLPGFAKRLKWFLDNRPDLGLSIAFMRRRPGESGHRLLAIPTRERLGRALKYMLDEREFLSDYGLRSVSRVHAEHPYILRSGGQEYGVCYVPGQSDSALFGGNSNWRGPIWFPVNYLIVEALERYHHYYGDSFTVECPTGSGRTMTLEAVARELASRQAKLFLADASGSRPVTAPRRATGTIRISRTSCSSTSTSTEIRDAAWARATRPDGPRSRPSTSR
jgi:hypothetical protein